MGSRVSRVKVQLDWKGIQSLPMEEIRLILRAADDLIGMGGRNLLSKILKGSKEKKVLELELDRNPAYGCFRHLKTEDVMAKIDWMIRFGYLRIEYDYRLPVIVYTDKGWEIERDQYADELLREWDDWLTNGIRHVNMTYLKDRNRGMILLFLDKIKQTGSPKYVPLLETWEKIEYKKVRQVIGKVITHLQER